MKRTKSEIVKKVKMKIARLGAQIDRSHKKYKQNLAKLDHLYYMYERVANNQKIIGGLSEEELRLYLNNEHLSYFAANMYLDFLIIDIKLRGLINTGNSGLPSLYTLISDISKKEDPLCTRIMDSLGEVDDFNNLNPNQKAILNGLMKSELIDKLLNRTMIESEYLGYLTGEISICRLVYESYPNYPINKNQFQEYFLPKLK